ncbi:conserved hypothetical protein [Vibrio coralliirubri]|nr:conserved hypothetical protein [Vibrio coralliirubri]CDS99688.1 conserved hypothetical protein [Vibrio coralliirubri]CDT49808.1 conserved hypothetical protein [Vibrio coralliirubri]CDU09163.1 conserved hypothetical protein [Vibrio coralliirubri]CDU13147.1 conserved hypothetical protein [Vibrio coralliirubri]
MNVLEQALPYSEYQINSIQRFGEYRMKTIRSIVWFLFGGAFMGLAWWFFGLLAFPTIVGIA